MNISAEQPEGIKIFLYLFKWKYYIIVFVFISTLSALIFSGPDFIKPLYKSEVILYSAGTNSAKDLIEKNTGFGTEKEINEQIQILKSGILREMIMDKYKLRSHYDIGPGKKDELYKKFDDNVNIERTRYNSISVVVFDTDPILAAGIANDIVKMGDEVKMKILSYNLKSAYNAMVEENRTKMNKADSLPTMINYFPSSYIITPAEVSDKKVFPLRWLIVLITFISSLLFSSSFFLLIEKFKNINSELKKGI